MRVLVIEDDSATAQSIELMLKSESFNVYTTDLGKRVSTLAVCTTTTHPARPDLPDMSGLRSPALAARLK